MHSSQISSLLVLSGLGLSLTALWCGSSGHTDFAYGDAESAPSSTAPSTTTPSQSIADASTVGAMGSTSSTGDALPPPVSVGDAASAASAEAGSLDAGLHGGDAAAGRRKRGVAYGYNSDADLAALSAGISWWYNWSPQPDGTLTQTAASLGVEFVPMAWGGSDADPVVLDRRVPAGAKYLLTFNEPESASQANLTPAQAAALWPKIEAFANARNMQIVSPAVNFCAGNCNATSPYDWLDRFFAACAGCRVDFIALHWYACTKAALTTTLAQYEAKYTRPLWVTEFSCLDTSNVTEPIEQQYMRDAVAALESDPMVFRYAWFTGRYPQHPPIDLLSSNSGVLAPLGQEYVSLPKVP